MVKCNIWEIIEHENKRLVGIIEINLSKNKKRNRKISPDHNLKHQNKVNYNRYNYLIKLYCFHIIPAYLETSVDVPPISNPMTGRFSSLE